MDVSQLPEELRLSGMGPYCGVFCLYAVAELEGVETELVSLLKPEYIGSRMGSTFLELKQAAQDLGLHVAPMRNLSGSYLRSTPYHMILHVKRDPFNSKAPDHYILFLGIEGNQARIFDPPNPPTQIPLYELARRWNGDGLAVSSQPIDEKALWVPVFKQRAKIAGVVVFLLGSIHLVRRRIKHRHVVPTGPKRAIMRAAASCSLLAAFAVVIGILYSILHPAGFLSEANATQFLQEAHFSMFLPKVGLKEMKRLVEKRGAVFVDARNPADFEAGAIEGAVNIPTFLNLEGGVSRLAGIPKDSRIIVYCQSSSCPFANIVAKRLFICGYENTSVFKGGWRRWISRATEGDQ